MDILKQAQADIAKKKKALVRRWARYGPRENFGRKEVRAIEDKYFGDMYSNSGVREAVLGFGDWCMDYTGEGK